CNLSSRDGDRLMPVPSFDLIQNADFSQGWNDWTIFFGTDGITTTNNGAAVYGVLNAFAAAKTILEQGISNTLWSVGKYLMLSAYVEDATQSTPNAGAFVIAVNFYNASNALISSVQATNPLNGTNPK